MQPLVEEKDVDRGMSSEQTPEELLICKETEELVRQAVADLPYKKLLQQGLKDTFQLNCKIEDLTLLETIVLKLSFFSK